MITNYIFDKGSRPLDFGCSEPTVRVNSVSSEHCKLDIQEIFKGLEQSKLPNSIHLPKGRILIIELLSGNEKILVYTFRA